MFYCNVEKCIRNSVKCPLSSECSSWYIRILALLISPNNECDLVISRFVCPPRPAAWIPPRRLHSPPHPTLPPTPPYTGVLAQCNEIITGLVSKRVYLANGVAGSFA